MYWIRLKCIGKSITYFPTTGPLNKNLVHSKKHLVHLINNLAKKNSSILLILYHICNIIKQLICIQFVFSFFFLWFEQKSE